MRQIFMICALASSFALGQSGAAPQKPQSSAPPLAVQKSPLTPDQVPMDAIVMKIKGVCSSAESGASAETGDCSITFTRAQFETMLKAIGVDQVYNPAARRGLAQGYAQLLALANEGERAGVDKGAEFQELMKVVRVRAVAESYRRWLQEQYNNPSQEQITAYYTQNPGQFEQVQIDRILIPPVNSKARISRPAFEKKARQVADDVRERAAHGEDMNSLEREAYATLGLSNPPVTDLGARRKDDVPAISRKDILALKPGEVTKVEVEPAGFLIYKVRSKGAMPLQQARAEIVRELHQKSVQAHIKEVLANVQTDLNDQFFSVKGVAPPPLLRPDGSVAAPRAGSAVPASQASAPFKTGTHK
ncbi:MAG: peptidylprolyl isomerase [Candidatus Angelobacter sp.]